MARSRKSFSASSIPVNQAHLLELEQRLKEAEETLQAIREGSVDALVVESGDGDQIYTLKSADYPYRLIIDKMTQGAVIFDENGSIFYANATFVSMTDLSSQDLFGYSIYSLISKDDREFFKELIAPYSSKIPRSGTIALNGKDGQELPVFVGLTTINIEGQPLLCAILTDLTEQKKLDMALVEEKFSRMILDQTGEAVVVCDPVGRIVRTSQATTNLIPGSLIDKPFHEVFHFTSQMNPDQPSHAAQSCHDSKSLIDEVLEGKNFRGLELNLVNNGKPISLILSAQPLNDEEKRTIGAVITMVDITQRKKAEQDLKELNESLEQRIQMRTQDLLTYQRHLRDMSSELVITEQRERRRLATELHDYLAQLLVVCRMKLAQANLKDCLPELQSQIQDIDRMLGDSLTYTRTLIAELSPNILYELGIGPALVWLGSQLERHGLHVEIWDQAENMKLQEDYAIFVFQSVRELLFNVLKHAETSSATITLNRTSSHEFEVVVEDGGKGFTLTKETQDYTSPGKFGLFSIRERVEALGGRMQIETKAGGGTRIMLVVPCLDTPISDASREPTLLPGRQGDSSLRPTSKRKGIRILLVDDHALVRQGIRGLLEVHSDFLVVGEAQDGLEAIEMARVLQPDVIIMDINMPKLNGIEATKRILQEFPSISTIGLSVHDDKQVQKLLQEAGASMYLTKNGISSQLVDGIRLTVSRAQTPR